MVSSRHGEIQWKISMLGEIHPSTILLLNNNHSSIDQRPQCSTTASLQLRMDMRILSMYHNKPTMRLHHPRNRFPSLHRWPIPSHQSGACFLQWNRSGVRSRQLPMALPLHLLHLSRLLRLRILMAAPLTSPNRNPDGYLQLPLALSQPLFRTLISFPPSIRRRSTARDRATMGRRRNRSRSLLLKRRRSDPGARSSTRTTRRAA